MNSSLDADKLRLLAKRHGADDWICKSGSKDGLLKKIAALRLVELVVALMFVGCVSPERFVFVEHRLASEAQGAMHAWNWRLQRTCPDVRLVLTDDHDVADITISFGQTSENLVGSEKSGRIWVDPEKAALYPDTIGAVVAHELGHALGAEHTQNREDIMHAPVRSHRVADTLSISDVYQVCSHWGAGAP